MKIKSYNVDIVIDLLIHHHFQQLFSFLINSIRVCFKRPEKSLLSIFLYFLFLFQLLFCICYLSYHKIINIHFFLDLKKQNTFRHLHLITPTGNLYFLEDYLIHNLLYTKLGYSIYHLSLPKHLERYHIPHTKYLFEKLLVYIHICLNYLICIYRGQFI